MTVSAMIEAVKQMTRQDRIQLMQAILDEMAEDSDAVELSDEQKAELDRRIADDDAHPEDGVPWEQVLSAARARHGR